MSAKLEWHVITINHMLPASVILNITIPTLYIVLQKHTLCPYWNDIIYNCPKPLLGAWANWFHSMPDIQMVYVLYPCTKVLHCPAIDSLSKMVLRKTTSISLQNYSHKNAGVVSYIFNCFQPPHTPTSHWFDIFFKSCSLWCLQSQGF